MKKNTFFVLVIALFISSLALIDASHAFQYDGEFKLEFRRGYFSQGGKIQLKCTSMNYRGAVDYGSKYLYKIQFPKEIKPILSSIDITNSDYDLESAQKTDTTLTVYLKHNGGNMTENFAGAGFNIDFTVANDLSMGSYKIFMRPESFCRGLNDTELNYKLGEIGFNYGGASQIVDTVNTEIIGDDGIVLISDEGTPLGGAVNDIIGEIPVDAEVSDTGSIRIGETPVIDLKLNDYVSLDLLEGTVIEESGDIISSKDGSIVVHIGERITLNVIADTVITLDDESDLGYVLKVDKHFVDVSNRSWYSYYVMYLRSNNILMGTSENPLTFSPDIPINRAMAATVFYRLSNNDMITSIPRKFQDVVANSYYADAVDWAVDRGIVNGYGHRAFGPTDSITREQLATMVYRFTTKVKDVEASDLILLRTFTDREEIKEYSRVAVAFCIDNGILKGRGNGLFDPKGAASRAEFSAVITRLLDYLAR